MWWEFPDFGMADRSFLKKEGGAQGTKTQEVRNGESGGQRNKTNGKGLRASERGDTARVSKRGDHVEFGPMMGGEKTQ